MNDFEEHADGILELITDLGDACPQFAVGDADAKFSCLPGGHSKSKELETGGYGITCDLTLLVPVAAFGPDTNAETQRDLLLKKKIVYRAQNYRVDQIIIFPGAKLFRFICNSATKGI